MYSQHSVFEYWQKINSILDEQLKPERENLKNYFKYIYIFNI